MTDAFGRAYLKLFDLKAKYGVDKVAASKKRVVFGKLDRGTGRAARPPTRPQRLTYDEVRRIAVKHRQAAGGSRAACVTIHCGDTQKRCPGGG